MSNTTGFLLLFMFSNSKHFVKSLQILKNWVDWHIFKNWKPTNGKNSLTHGWKRLKKTTSPRWKFIIRRRHPTKPPLQAQFEGNNTYIHLSIENIAYFSRYSSLIPLFCFKSVKLDPLSVVLFNFKCICVHKWYIIWLMNRNIMVKFYHAENST
jgi:hypothetical protein